MSGLWTALRERLRQHYVARKGNWQARRRRMDVSQPSPLGSALAHLARSGGPLPADRPDSGPVFVLSASWRSGSTWLQRLIMTAPDILLWGEPFDRAAIVQSLARQLRPFDDDWPPAERYAEANPRDLADRWVGNLYPPLPALVQAHRAFLCALFETPARARGFGRWGLKETRLDTGHAAYLRLLFPGARFLFLVRHPVDAYESYRTWGTWFDEWPAVIATPGEFGRMWARLAADFLARHREVDGMLLKYEDLVSGAADVDAIARYAALRLEPAAAGRVITGRTQAKTGIPAVEQRLLLREVGPAAEQLGYRLD
jgi:hypothetical protein